MNVLEKILEEIDILIEKHKNKAFELVGKEPLTQCYTETDIEQIKVHELASMKEIIRSHMNEVDDIDVITNDGWIPVEERLPENDDYIMLSFENFTVPAIGRYEEDEDGGGSFYLGDDDEGSTCASEGLFVNAWRPLPEPYKGE